MRQNLPGPSADAPLTVIGVVRSAYTEPETTPIQAALNRAGRGTIEIAGGPARALGAGQRPGPDALAVPAPVFRAPWRRSHDSGCPDSAAMARHVQPAARRSRR